MRVCLLINSLGHGGAETLLLRLVRNAAPEEVTFTVCYLGGSDDLAPEFEAEGVRVVSFGASTDPPQFDPTAIPAMVRFFRNEEFDVLHAHLPYAQALGRVVARLFGPGAVVTTKHTLPGNHHPVERLADSLTRPLDDASVAVSTGVEAAYRGEASMYDPPVDGRWCTIFNGIDAESFNHLVRTADTAEIEDRWSVGNGPESAGGRDDPVFLNVGRYVPQKAQSDLVAAMSKVTKTLPDARLFLVGWGELAEQLDRQIREAGLTENVFLTGRSENVHRYYAVADAFVLPSTYEGLPMTLLEAMAAELPVIASDIPGVADVMAAGETGELVAPNAPAELAAAMIALSSPERRAEYGRRGYRRVSTEFAMDSTVDDYLTLYEELLERE